MKKLAALLVASLLVVLAPAASAEQGKSRGARSQEKRDRTDAMARETLDRLFEESDKARALYEKAYGHAVFNNLKISLGLTGGGGVGVAVEKESGRRTYMKMGTAGLNIGLGGQKYHVVFLFQDQQTFDTFLRKGWQADASASAVAGTAGANAETTFINGLAIFQLTTGGLMLQADISGTKYWKNKKLNRSD